MANDQNREYDSDDSVTIKIDRRRAEDLYYDLLLALGGQVAPQYLYGKNGKSGGKTRRAAG